MIKDPSKIQASYSMGRREFLASITATTGLGAISESAIAHDRSFTNPAPALTVQQVIDLILKEIPGAPFPKTVDTIKSGNGGQLVTGIVTTMFATVDVIRKAASVGANFIIAHEPTFYNHNDDTDWLEKDQVYNFKRDLLNKHKIVVWRFHDYIHTYRPDGVLMGVLTKLGWEKYYNADNPALIVHPPITVDEIAAVVKKNMDISMVRIIGDRKQICKRIALIPGAAGGKAQIELLQKQKPDVLLVGEVHEWETAEYVRDAQAMGLPMSLIVMGHAESEEPGMAWLVSWLSPRVKEIKITHVPSHDPFQEV